MARKEEPMSEKEREWLDDHFNRLYERLGKVEINVGVLNANLQAYGRACPERHATNVDRINKIEGEQKTARGNVLALGIATIAALIGVVWEYVKSGLKS